MDEIALAGLPRLVPVAFELRRRALTMLAIAASAMLSYVASWALDQPADLRRALIGLAASGPISLAGAWLIARRRLREGRRPSPPPGVAVYETRADGRDRHARAAILLVLGAMALLVFDRVTGGEQTMAGLVVGLFGAIGALDLIEARGWDRVQRALDARIYLLLPSSALIAGFGAWTTHQIPGSGGIDADGVPRGPGSSRDASRDERR